MVRKTNWKTIESNLRNWKPSRIFVNSMSDTFHESIYQEDIESMFDMMKKYPQHQYLILTKRIQRAEVFFHTRPLTDNFWIGTSIESNKTKHRLEHLGKIKAKVRFVSFEPLLDYVSIEPINCFEWAIVGGESGYNPRLPDPYWIDDLIEQLQRMQIPVFYKQFGGSTKCKCHNAWGCRLHNGKTLDEMPLLTNHGRSQNG